MEIFAAHTRFESHLLLLQRVRTLSSSLHGLIHSSRSSSRHHHQHLWYTYYSCTARFTHIYVHKRIIYTLCVRPIVSRYNGDVFGHRELNGRRNSRAFRRIYFIKYQTKLSSKSIIWYPTGAYIIYILYGI